MTLAEALGSLDGKAELTADDAHTVREIVYGGDCSVNQEEAEALFGLNANAGEISPEWRALFLEAMTDFVVRQQTPAGYIGDDRADWLVGLMSTHRTMRGDEVELLVRLLEEADAAPECLSSFTLGVVQHLALWRLKTAGSLAASDIDRLRRVVFAKGGAENVAVTRAEAEALFDINDEQRSHTPNPAWSDFFARAVGNAVLFVPTWQANAATELNNEAFLADTRAHPLRGLESVLKPGTRSAMTEGFSDVMHMNFLDSDLKRLGERVDADDAAEAAASVLTDGEAHWLEDRIGRDGVFDPAERALIAFLRENASKVDPSLTDLVAQLSDTADAQAARRSA